MSLADNIRSREVAEELIEFLGDELTPLAAGVRQLVLERLSAWSHLQLGRPERTTPDGPKKMTDAQARHFGQQWVPSTFTAQAGKRIEEVPLSYWFHILSSNPFLEELRQYLRSDRVQAAQQDSDED